MRTRPVAQGSGVQGLRARPAFGRLRPPPGSIHPPRLWPPGRMPAILPLDETPGAYAVGRTASLCFRGRTPTMIVPAARNLLKGKALSALCLPHLLEPHLRSQPMGFRWANTHTSPSLFVSVRPWSLAQEPPNWNYWQVGGTSFPSRHVLHEGESRPEKDYRLCLHQDSLID